MSGYLDKEQVQLNGDAKARRKLLDQRRMEYRRAIENYAEQRHLQQQLADYPELIAASLLQRRMAPSANRPLKNVGEAAEARQKQARKRSLRVVNEHSEPVFNAVSAT